LTQCDIAETSPRCGAKATRLSQIPNSSQTAAGSFKCALKILFRAFQIVIEISNPTHAELIAGIDN
jgi:hypothetical protein